MIQSKEASHVSPVSHPNPGDRDYERDLARAEERGRILSILERLTRLSEEHEEQLDGHASRITIMETKWLFAAALGGAGLAFATALFIWMLTGGKP